MFILLIVSVVVYYGENILNKKRHKIYLVQKNIDKSTKKFTKIAKRSITKDNFYSLSNKKSYKPLFLKSNNKISTHHSFTKNLKKNSTVSNSNNKSYSYIDEGIREYKNITNIRQNSSINKESKDKKSAKVVVSSVSSSVSIESSSSNQQTNIINIKRANNVSTTPVKKIKKTLISINKTDNKNIKSFVVAQQDNNNNLELNTLSQNLKIASNTKYARKMAPRDVLVSISNTTAKKHTNILIIDNDSYDPDYIPLVLNAIHENRVKRVKVGLIIITEDGLTNKTNMLYRSILKEFNSNIPLALAHNVADRAFRSKLTNNLENYTDIIHDDETEDAINILQETLEAQEDKTVSYATGGKLIFLSKFLSDPQRLELFKLKVKEITFGLDCNPQDMACGRDFNLAATQMAYNATQDIYAKLHGKIPFIVVDDKRGKSVRSLDIFKNANIPLMNHLLGTNIYGTYGDHNAGDIEILFSKSQKASFTKHKCNILFENRAFKAKSIDKAGGDYLFINNGLNINNLTKENYKALINSYNSKR